jgi:ABC-type nitrate/sulfonate/bicarbonate transport system permease component
MLTRLAISVLGLFIALAMWELAGSSIGRYFPSPRAVAVNAFENFSNSPYLRGLGLPRGGYLPHLIYTTRTVVEGVVIGCSLGLIAGFASFRWRAAEQVFDPLIAVFGTLPILVAAPFFLIWFGLVPAAQIILVTFYTFMVFYLYVLRAARNVDVKYLEYARTLGARDGLAFRQVIVPAMLPEAFGGIRVAFASAWGLAAVSELLGARFGVGRVIVTLATVYDVAGMMALILLLSLLAIVIDALIVLLRAYLTRWSATSPGV